MEPHPDPHHLYRRTRDAHGKPVMRGLGDAVARVIHAVTRIKPCESCKRRQQWLNKRFPISQKSDVRSQK